jgi:uncharacterized protein (UPF0332 family)
MVKENESYYDDSIFLTPQRIHEAESNMKSYLSEGFIKKHDFRQEIFLVFMDNSNESLEMSEYLYDKSDLWTIVTAYYSMFYISNAVLLKLGFKIGEKIPHKVATDAMIVLVRDKLKSSLLRDYEDAQNEALAGIKADSLLEGFDLERKKRGLFQYETTKSEKHSKAQTSLKRAKNYVFEMKKLLKEIK